MYFRLPIDMTGAELQRAIGGGFTLSAVIENKIKIVKDSSIIESFKANFFVFNKIR